MSPLDTSMRWASPRVNLHYVPSLLMPPPLLTRTTCRFGCLIRPKSVQAIPPPPPKTIPAQRGSGAFCLDVYTVTAPFMCAESHISSSGPTLQTSAEMRSWHVFVRIFFHDACISRLGLSIASAVSTTGLTDPLSLRLTSCMGRKGSPFPTDCCFFRTQMSRPFKRHSMGPFSLGEQGHPGPHLTESAGGVFGSRFGSEPARSIGGGMNTGFDSWSMSSRPPQWYVLGQPLPCDELQQCPYYDSFVL